MCLEIAQCVKSDICGPLIVHFYFDLPYKSNVPYSNVPYSNEPAHE